jgi:Holliday junction resolvase-like predicted endonuclease
LNRAQPKQATQLAKLLWVILCSKARTDGEVNHFEGRLEWKRYRHQYSEVETFDPWFVERLREEAWLPDRKGQLHGPRDMQQHHLPLGFERCQKLIEVLQFQTPLLERLKQAGVPAKLAKVLELAQSDPQFADEFCRSYKRRCVVAQSESAEINVGTTTLAGSEAVDGVTNEDTAHQQEVISSPRTDFLQTRIRVSPRDASASTVESLEVAAVRSKVDRAGIAQVKAYEQKEGRVVEELAHNHPGYDLISKDESGEIVRYIEVKSTRSEWNGILLSQIQFQEAQRLGELYWLYVVENTESPNPRVYPIQNPAGLAEKFIFDNGWKAVSEALSNLERHS